VLLHKRIAVKINSISFHAMKIELKLKDVSVEKLR
jgi:hypothetical protein